MKYIVQVEFKVKVLGTPKPSLQWFKDDLEVEFFFGQDESSGRCHSTPQVFSSDRLEIKDEEDGGSVIVREAR